MIVSKELQAHFESNAPLVDNVFRYGSEKWGELIREARKLYSHGLLDELSLEDYELLESDAAELIGHQGTTVMLDVPMMNHEKPGWFYVYVFDGTEVSRLDFESVTGWGLVTE